MTIVSSIVQAGSPIKRIKLQNLIKMKKIPHITYYLILDHLIDHIKKCRNNEIHIH